MAVAAAAAAGTRYGEQARMDKKEEGKKSKTGCMVMTRIRKRGRGGSGGVGVGAGKLSSRAAAFGLSGAQMKNGDEIIRRADSKRSSKYVNALNFTLICSTASVSPAALPHLLPFRSLFVPLPLLFPSFFLSRSSLRLPPLSLPPSVSLTRAPPLRPLFLFVSLCAY